MRRKTWAIGVVVTALLTSVAWMGIASAQTFRAGDNVTITSDERIDSSLFATGSNVDINSDVNGDVFCAGQSITISGSVSGDVICAGQSITISGPVSGDVRLAGQMVSLDADVAGNATIAGQTFTLRSNCKIGGDLSLGAATATLDGQVARDVALAGQSVTFASDIGRNVKGSVEKLTISNSAHIQGNIDYTSRNDLEKGSSARIDGKVTRSEPESEMVRSSNIFAFRIGWFIYSLLAMMFLTFMLALVFPQRMNSATDIDIHSAWRPLVIGFAACFAVPALMIAFAFTVIGLPVAMLLGLVWLVVLMLSGPFAACYAGRLLLQDSQLPLVIALAGSAVLTVLLFIPLLGFLVFLLTAWVGSGLVLQSLSTHWQRPVYTRETVIHDERGGDSG